MFTSSKQTIAKPAAASNYFLQKKELGENIKKASDSFFIQPKLTIGSPDDIYEQEADAMADKVMRMPMPGHGDFFTANNNIQRKCAHCEDEEKQLQKKENGTGSNSIAPPIVHDVINSSSGKPLDNAIRSFMEPRFNYDFSNVKIHDNELAAKSANSINALAYTSGNNVVFNSGQYNTNSDSGKKLLAHELTHVVQQQNNMAVQKKGPTINSPVADEFLTQVSDVHGMIDGRPLLRNEEDLVRQVFQDSVDYSRVRIIITDIAGGTTVGNNIRLPNEFSMSNSYWREVLVHEMTHVWQYQHSGSGYITTSLFQQLYAGITTGSRNFAYAYTIDATKSFFDYYPEQQALIVENYFSMLRDRNGITGLSATATSQYYDSNYFGANGFKAQLNASDRMVQILAELPQHQIWIDQMRATPYRSELDIAAQRRTDLMIRMPGSEYLPPSSDRMPDSVPSFLKITF